jgi:tetratricopeptide (TPR) repeat protein
MLDCQIFGLRPGRHHFVNALIHGGNTVLVFVVLRAMTGMAWRSALVAALFAVHPLHVESVAWVAERKDLLSTFFGLLAIAAYTSYARAPSWSRYGWVGCFFGLSLLSKPMLVTLPFVFLLLDVWPLKRFWNGRHSPAKNPKFGSLFFEKLPLLAMSVASSIVTFKAQHAAGAVAPIDILPLSQRLENAIVAYLGYLYKTFWPVDLAVFYPRPDQLAITTLILAVLVIVGITIGVGVFSRTRPWLAIGWLWFLGTLVPVIGLVQVGDQSMADRYAYVPLIGVFIMIAWSLPAAFFPSNNRGSLASMVVVLPVIALGALTAWQVRVWKNTETLFGHTLEVTQGNFIAHNLVAGALGQKGDLAGAREHVEKALQLKPSYAGAHYNLGMIMLRQMDFGKAEEQFKLALQTLPLDPMIWNALGVAQINLGQTEEAISNYEHALKLDPNFPDALMDLGSAFLAQGKYTEAAQMSEKALSLKPGVAQTSEILGAALLNLGRVGESISQSRMAITLKPDLLFARVNLAMGLLAKGSYDEAIAHVEYALRLAPQDEVVQKLLATAKRKRDEAANQP